jgi:hypothetical protein
VNFKRQACPCMSIALNLTLTTRTMRVFTHAAKLSEPPLLLCRADMYDLSTTRRALPFVAIS